MSSRNGIGSFDWIDLAEERNIDGLVRKVKGKNPPHSTKCAELLD
jgi:hypothetical protein